MSHFHCGPRCQNPRAKMAAPIKTFCAVHIYEATANLRDCIPFQNSWSTLMLSQRIPSVSRSLPDILFLKKDSSIFRQSSCGFSMMKQVRLCAVWLFHEAHKGLKYATIICYYHALENGCLFLTGKPLTQ